MFKLNDTTNDISDYINFTIVYLTQFWVIKELYVRENCG